MIDTLSSDIPPELQEAISRVLERACELDVRLATAESCTGGLIASLLTDVTGCSHAFDRGFVAYTFDAKREMLGVPADILEDFGAVSEPTARAMSVGALERSGSDIAFAVTGFAGPTDANGEEGLVHFACSSRGGVTIHCEKHFGAIGRGRIRLACVKVALEMLEEMLSGTSTKSRDR
jgi:nicotinamide-nucleotide amidase